MLEPMSEPTSSSDEPTTRPVATSTEPTAHSTHVERDQSTHVERDRRHSRVTAVAAWVGIVAGVVFIVAVIFFSGFILGAHAGGGHRWHHGGGDREFSMHHR